MTLRAIGRIALLATALPLLAACGTDGPVDTLSNLNPFKKAEQPVPGNRQPILETSDPTQGVTAGRAKIGPASAAGDWPQTGGNASNDLGNLAGSIKGERYWSQKAGASGFGGDYLGLSSSKGRSIFARPVAADGKVYVYDAAGIVSAYKIANGGGVWHASAYPQGQTNPLSGGGVAVSGNSVVVSTGYGEVVALDASSSSILWRTKIDGPARTAPAIGGGKVVVASQSGVVEALDLATGAKAWRAEVEASQVGLITSVSAAVTADTAVVPSGSGQIYAFDLKTGAQKWQSTIAGNSSISAVAGLRDASASPVVHGDTVYATGIGGSLVALSMKSGENLWQQPIGSADTPVVTGDSLFLVDLQGRMIAVDRAKGKVIWAQKLPDAPDKRRVTWAGPVMVGGKLYAVSSDGRIGIVDAVSGALAGTATLGYLGAIAPIIASGKMIVLGSDGILAVVN